MTRPVPRRRTAGLAVVLVLAAGATTAGALAHDGAPATGASATGASAGAPSATPAPATARSATAGSGAAAPSTPPSPTPTVAPEPGPPSSGAASPTTPPPHAPPAVDPGADPAPRPAAGSPRPAAPAPGPGDRRTVDVSVTVHGWDAGRGVAEVVALAATVGDAGTCTLTLRGPAGVVTTTPSPAVPDASTTSCGSLVVERARLAPGAWHAVVTYRSGTATGTSAPVTIEVP